MFSSFSETSPPWKQRFGFPQIGFDALPLEQIIQAPAVWVLSDETLNFK